MDPLLPSVEVQSEYWDQCPIFGFDELQEHQTINQGISAMPRSQLLLERNGTLIHGIGTSELMTQKS